MYEGDWGLRLSRLLRQHPDRRDWQVPANIWGLGITSLLTDISSEMVISVLPAYLVLTGGLAPLMFGFANGLHEGGPIVATWVGGWIADRSQRRKLTAGLGYSISAACRLGWLVLFSNAFAAVAALILGDRLGKALRSGPRDALISASVPPARLATAFGVHRAFDAAGAALGPVLAFVLLWRLPRRYDVIFLTSFVVAVLGLAALALLVDEAPPVATGRARPALPTDAGRIETAAIIGDVPLQRVLVMAFAFGLFTISDAFIYLVLIARSHANAYWIPLLYTGTAVTFLLLAVPVGYLADRVGRRRVFILGHAPLLLAYAAAAGGLTRWPWNAVACVGLLGTYYACADGVLAGLASSLLPEDGRAMGLAWVATGVGAGRLCSSILFGLLWARSGNSIAVAVFAAGLVIVGLLALLTHRRDSLVRA
jgi:MFS family permease